MRLTGQPYYKIGLTHDVLTRQRQLQTSSPFDIEILRVYAAEVFDAPLIELEKMLHNVFQRFHVRREWYSPDDAALVVLLDETKLFEAVWHYVAHRQVI